MLIWSSHRSTGAARSPARSWPAARTSRGRPARTPARNSASSTAKPGHVHLLVHYPPKIALSRLISSLKGVSARRLHQEFPGHTRKYPQGEHSWSPSYLAASCGGAPLAVIKEYIEQQKRPG